MVVHVVSPGNSEWVSYSPEGSNVALRFPSAVLCDSLTRRSRPTLLSRTHEGCERLTRCVPDAAGNRIQPGAPRRDARSDHHYGEAFSPLAQPHSQLDRVPR
jgi:hypothetical protein